MRLSDPQRYRTLTANLQRTMQKTFDIQKRLSSGSKLSSPSENPIDYTRRMRYDDTISQSMQYMRNISAADMEITIAEGSLGELTNSLIRAKEIAIGQASTSANPQTRQIMSVEIKNIASQIAFLANTKVGDKFIFAGHNTDTKPFNDATKGSYTGTTITPSTTPITITTGVNDVLDVTINGINSSITLSAGVYNTGAGLSSEIDTQLDANPAYSSRGGVRFANSQLILETDEFGTGNAVSVTGGNAAASLGFAAGTAVVGVSAGATYSGNNGVINNMIDNGTSVAVNVSGDTLFKGAGGGLDVFAVLETLRVGLASNIPADVSSSIDALDTAMDQVVSLRTDLGSRLTLLDNKKTSLTERKFQAEVLRSDLNDIDLVKVISEFTRQESVVETAKAVAARMISRTLLDFLR